MIHRRVERALYSPRVNDTRTLGSLIEEHARLFTADYDSRDDETVAFERIDEILPELRKRCEQLEPAPDDDELFSVLVGALDSEDTEVHNSAYVGLGRLGHPAVVPLFLERINHGKSRFGLLITWAEEADAEMAKTLRRCLDRMPGDFADRAFAEVAVHLAETRNGAPRNPTLLSRALEVIPRELARWVTKMVDTIRQLDVEELPDQPPSPDEDVPVLERVTSGIAAGGWIRGLAWSPDGQRLYVGVQEPQNANGLRTFDRKGNLLEQPRLEDRFVTDLSLSSDGRWVAVAARKGRSAIVDAQSGEVVREVDEGLGSMMPRVAFSPDDRHVAFGGNHVVVIGVDDWSVVETFSLPIAPNVKAARDWLSQTSESRKGALKALESLDVTPNWRLFAEKYARGSDKWKLLHDALPDSRPNALAWRDPETLLVGGQAVFEKQLGAELRRVHTVATTSAPKLWPDAQIVGLAWDAQNVWVATRDGLVRYDHDFDHEHVFSQITYGKVLCASGERMFVGCYGRSGLWCIEGDEASRIDGPVDVGGLAVRADGSVWCGERVVAGWDAELTPLGGPRHSERIVGIFTDSDGHAVTCDEGGSIVRHGSASMLRAVDSGRCVSAGASADGEWMALGIETRTAGELVCVRGDEVLWRKSLRKGKPWAPLFHGEHVFFVAESKLQRFTLDGNTARTKKLKLGMDGARLGSELAVYVYDGKVLIVSLADQKVTTERPFDGRLSGFAGTPNGRRLCVAFEHGAIDVVDVATMQLEVVVRVNASAITCTDEALYVASRGRLLKHAFGSKRVDTLGEVPLESLWRSTMAVVGDEIWIGDGDGVLARAPVD